MPGKEEALKRGRDAVVHEMATCWNVMTNGLFAMRRHVIDDPELGRILDDMIRADTRGRALFESLRKLL